MGIKKNSKLRELRTEKQETSLRLPPRGGKNMQGMILLSLIIDAGSKKRQLSGYFQRGRAYKE